MKRILLIITILLFAVSAQAASLQSMGGGGSSGTATDLNLTGQATGYFPVFNGTNWVATNTISPEIDDSAPQFVSATASKGKLKYDQTGITNGKVITVKWTCADNLTFNPTLTATDYSIGALNFATTGTITGAIKVVTKSDEGANSITAAEALGSLVLLGHDNAISDLTLPDYTAAAASDKAKIGSSVCVWAASAYAHTIHPAADDKIRTINGTLNAAGAGITYTTASTPIGGFVCFILTDGASDVGHWTEMGMNGTWPIH